MTELLRSGGDSPVWMLRELECTRRQVMDAWFAQLPLQKPAQHFLLFTIERLCQNGGIPSQRDIAATLHLAPATITAGLRQLERHGFIRRTTDSDDARVNRVEITDAGSAMAKQCRDYMDKLETAMFRDFSDEELRALSSAFERMCGNLTSFITEAKSLD